MVIAGLVQLVLHPSCVVLLYPDNQEVSEGVLIARLKMTMLEAIPMATGHSLYLFLLTPPSLSCSMVARMLLWVAL